MKSSTVRFMETCVLFMNNQGTKDMHFGASTVGFSPSGKFARMSIIEVTGLLDKKLATKCNRKNNSETVRGA